jgi:hypothetical protein
MLRTAGKEYHHGGGASETHGSNDTDGKTKRAAGASTTSIAKLSRA